MYINEKLNEFNEYIRFRKVAVIGLGVSNLPLLDYLHDKKANVTINRKMLSDLAITDPKAFSELAEVAKKA